MRRGGDGCGGEGGEGAVGEALEFFGGGGGFEFVGLFDEGTDDEGLVAGGGFWRMRA